MFAGLTINSNGEIEACNEVVFFDMITETWTKPDQMFADQDEDIPTQRFGATMVNYDDKLWVYGGTDQKSQFSGLFSFQID